VIRVPEVLASEVLAIARQLDNGEPLVTRGCKHSNSQAQEKAQSDESGVASPLVTSSCAENSVMSPLPNPTPEEISQEIGAANAELEAHLNEKAELQYHLQVLMNIIEHLGPVVFDVPSICTEPIDIGAFGKALEGLKIRMNCLENKLSLANMRLLECQHRSRKLLIPEPPKPLPAPEPEPVDLDILVARRWQDLASPERLNEALVLLQELGGESYLKRKDIKEKAIAAYKLLTE